MSEQHLRDAFGRITPSDEAKQRMLDNILAAGEGAVGQTAAGETATARQVAEQTTAPTPTPAINQTLDVAGASDVVVPFPAKARKRSRFTALGLSVAACLVVLALANALILSPEFSEQLFGNVSPQAGTSSAVGDAADAPQLGEGTDMAPPFGEEVSQEDSAPPASTEPESSGDEDGAISEDVAVESPIETYTPPAVVLPNATPAVTTTPPEPGIDGLFVLAVATPLAAALAIIVCVLVRRRRESDAKYQ